MAFTTLSRHPVLSVRTSRIIYRHLVSQLSHLFTSTPGQVNLVSVRPGILKSKQCFHSQSSYHLLEQWCRMLAQVLYIHRSSYNLPPLFQAAFRMRIVLHQSIFNPVFHHRSLLLLRSL